MSDDRRQQRWLILLQQEQRLRKAAAADNPEEWYLHKLRQMLCRFFTEPEWYPATDCAEVRILEEAEAWVVEHGETLLEPTEQDLDEQIKAELRAAGYLE